MVLQQADSEPNSSTLEGDREAKGVTTPQTGQPTKKVRPVSKDLGVITLDGNRKVLLQQWECVVLEHQGDVVCCELYDLTDESNPIEYAEVLLREFNQWDRPLLIEGAVFYWSLGHLQWHYGKIERFNEFRVRRMPKLSLAKQKEITRKVKNLSGILLGK